MEKGSNRIKSRIKNNEERFSEAFAKMAGVIDKSACTGETSDREKRLTAIGEVLRYYRIEPQELPEGTETLDAQLDYLLRPSGMMRRNVRLEGDWYKRAVGAMLVRSGNSVAALIPHGFSGYMLFDPEDGSRRRVTKKTELPNEAVCFYRPLPNGKIGMRELAGYMAHSLSRADVLCIIAAALAAALIGLLPPYAVELLFSSVSQSGDASLIVPLVCFLIGISVSSALAGIVRGTLTARIRAKLDVAVSAAAMMRTLSLPAGFFRKYSAGDLASRLQQLSELCKTAADAVFTSGLTAVFSLVYAVQIFHYAPELTIPALCTMLASAAVTAVTVFMQTRLLKKKTKSAAKTDGTVFGLITGARKIKTAGAEKLAFAHWAEQYSKTARLQYDPPAFLKLSSAVIATVSLAGTIVIYACAASAGISSADYMAFNVSYGMMTAAFSMLAGVAQTFANIRPVMEMMEPFLCEPTETSAGHRAVTSLLGSIELDNVSFRYADDAPMILDNFSLRVRPGEYLAVAGRTGCGKTTLIRLLLGFERPCTGAVYYDGMDIFTADLQSLRRRIGVVTQDSRLFPGDIFSNITLSAPWLDLDEAWRAAELAGIADDIRSMPMGMHTVISEGNGGISGGQKQRLMIARAVAGHPDILLFDEATSALDNITQKQVSDALAGLECTRIVVAHRLSTIKQCDRVIVMDNGRIAEDDTYDNLIAKDGLFAQLIRRQMT